MVGRPWTWLAGGRRRSDTLARLWDRHQWSVVAMLVTQVVLLSAVALAGPMVSPGPAVAAVLLAGVGAGYAVYVVVEADRWLSWRQRQRERAGRATPRERGPRARRPPPR